MFAKHLTGSLLAPLLILTLAAAFAQSQPDPSTNHPAPQSTTSAGTTPTVDTQEPGTQIQAPATPSSAVTGSPDATAPENPTAPTETITKKHGKKHEHDEDIPDDPIQQGKLLLETRCSTCHSAPRPNAHTMSEWPEVLNRMAPRAFLRDSEAQLIRQYLDKTLNQKSQSDWDNNPG